MKKNRSAPIKLPFQGSKNGSSCRSKDISDLFERTSRQKKIFLNMPEIFHDEKIFDPRSRLLFIIQP
jgi:hypothetical protein